MFIQLTPLHSAHAMLQSSPCRRHVYLLVLQPALQLQWIISISSLEALYQSLQEANFHNIVSNHIPQGSDQNFPSILGFDDTHISYETWLQLQLVARSVAQCLEVLTTFSQKHR